MQGSSVDVMSSAAQTTDPDDPSALRRTRTLLERPLTRFLIALAAVFLAKQFLMVVIFPPFTGHDEVAHLAYVQTVVSEQRVPVLVKDQIPDQYYRYCQYILDWSPCEPDNPRWLVQPFRFADWGGAGVFPAGEQYAANHPPLYYLIASPIIRISEGSSPETQQYLLRVLAIPIGLAVVLLAFLTSWTVFPGDRFLGITVAAFVAFQPQISYEAAMVNNDVLSIAITSLILFLLVRGMRDRFPWFDCFLLGTAFGLALLIKGNSIVIAPIIAVAMVLGLGLRNVRSWVTKGIAVAGTGFLLALPWYVYLYRTYGNLDGLEQVKEIQQPWNRAAGTFSDLLFNRSFVWSRWQETWGAFGWRRIQLESTILWIIAVPIVVALVGLLVYTLRSLNVARQQHNDGEATSAFTGPSLFQAKALFVLFLACVVAYLAVVQFGTSFILTQARYYFPFVNGAALLIMLGARTLTPIRFQAIVQTVVVSGLVLMNVVIYTRYVIPYWHLSPW